MEITRNEKIELEPETPQKIAEVRSLKDRKVIHIKNTSSANATITIHFSETATITEGAGIVLNIGDSITDSNSEGYMCWQGAIWAYTADDNAVISIYER